MTDCQSCDNQNCPAKQKRPDESDREFQERQQLASRLCRIKHRIIVLSGKGGVGKSTVAVNLALALAETGRKVGLLDIDVHGPSVPVLLGLEGAPVRAGDDGMEPVRYGEGLLVMSIGFMLQGRDQPVIWRGPMKHGAIRQFVGEVAWGELDYLVVDAPPGTGDEPLSAAQVITDADGALIVTTPQEVALSDVRKCVNFCRRLGLRVLGVVENMSGFVCPHCGKEVPLFGRGGGERMAREMGVPFLGALPLEAGLAGEADAGRPFVRFAPGSPSARGMRAIRDELIRTLEGNER